jgi:hypothetical protein
MVDFLTPIDQLIGDDQKISIVHVYDYYQSEKKRAIHRDTFPTPNPNYVIPLRYTFQPSPPLLEISDDNAALLPQLNNDCLNEIVQFLSPNDRLVLRKVSKKLNQALIDSCKEWILCFSVRAMYENWESIKTKIISGGKFLAGISIQDRSYYKTATFNRDIAQEVIPDVREKIKKLLAMIPDQQSIKFCAFQGHYAGGNHIDTIVELFPNLVSLSLDNPFLQGNDLQKLTQLIHLKDLDLSIRHQGIFNPLDLIPTSKRNLTPGDLVTYFAQTKLSCVWLSHRPINNLVITTLINHNPLKKLNYVETSPIDKTTEELIAQKGIKAIKAIEVRDKEDKKVDL